MGTQTISNDKDLIEALNQRYYGGADFDLDTDDDWREAGWDVGHVFLTARDGGISNFAKGYDLEIPHRAVFAEYVKNLLLAGKVKFDGSIMQDQPTEETHEVKKGLWRKETVTVKKHHYVPVKKYWELDFRYMDQVPRSGGLREQRESYILTEDGLLMYGITRIFYNGTAQGEVYEINRWYPYIPYYYRQLLNCYCASKISCRNPFCSVRFLQDIQRHGIIGALNKSAGRAADPAPRPKPAVQPSKPSTVSVSRPQPAVQPSKPSTGSGLKSQPAVQPSKPSTASASRPQPAVSQRKPSPASAPKPQSVVKSNAAPQRRLTSATPAWTKNPAARDPEPGRNLCGSPYALYLMKYDGKETGKKLMNILTPIEKERYPERGFWEQKKKFKQLLDNLEKDPGNTPILATSSMPLLAKIARTLYEEGLSIEYKQPNDRLISINPEQLHWIEELAKTRHFKLYLTSYHEAQDGEKLRRFMAERKTQKGEEFYRELEKSPREIPVVETDFLGVIRKAGGTLVSAGFEQLILRRPGFGDYLLNGYEVASLFEQLLE